MKCWPPVAIKMSHKPFAAATLLGALLLAQVGTKAQNSPVTASNVTASNDPTFRRVSRRLLCQCGCNYMVLSCNMMECPSATFIRKTVQTSLASGKSEDAIVAAFVEQYGPRILPEPPRKGFSLAAWVMPFAVLLFGGALVSYILWQWKVKYRPAVVAAPAGMSIRATHATKEPSSAPASALVEKYRAQIDRELENE